VVQAKLEADGQRLATMEQQLVKVHREWDQFVRLEADAAWVANALADFGRIWDAMTLGNRGRLLRALVEKVVVSEAAGRAEVHLVDFSAPQAAPEAA
jgi:site-specific DNA recombinase